jgi:L-seryl-tRNA(Ser) seleniumtransferase
MEHPLAALPPVHQILGDPSFRAASAGLADRYRTVLVRRVVEQQRQALLDGSTDSRDPDRLGSSILRQCIREAQSLLRPFPRRVINGTGVLIHTNLGRAPLGEIADALGEADLAGYTDLEWKAETQSRGSRDLPLQRQLQLLTGAEAALVVNNCAGALVLALNTLASGKEVLVSRSELVEIGGSFRVPEIMEASGCRLREVGTTNKTRISDFERHAAPGGSVLLKVHQSNFVQRGFVEQVPVEAMVELGQRLGVPVIEDNGSGLVAEGVSLPADEPHVLASLEKGVDVVCCSADKLFGSLQAGIVLGRAEPIAAMRKNPLYRALRLDKVRIALLDRTLKRYLAGEADRLPLWRLFHADLDDLEARLGRLCLPGEDTRWRSVRRVPLQARLGGGSNPEASFESLGLELRHRELSAEALKQRFAMRAVPIVGYVRQDRLLLDFRTLFEHDLPEIQRALDELGGAPEFGA